MAKGDPYAPRERAYALPFAEQLVANSRFREWLLMQAGLGGLAAGARLLHEEMKAQRSKSAATWWNSHFTLRCRCEGCRGGRETDLLAIFELADETRFALHVEFKHPSDRLHRGQAANYALRAACWVKSCPPLVVPHSHAATMLVCSALRLGGHAEEANQFNSLVTFQAISSVFPEICFPDTQTT